MSFTSMINWIGVMGRNLAAWLSVTIPRFRVGLTRHRMAEEILYS
jgi:Trk-type K+ transport system membrane component